MKKEISSNYAIVGSDSCNILFKKENNSVYFRDTQKSTLINSERRFSKLLKWIFDKKALLGVDIVLDIKNYVEELNSIYEDREIIKNLKLPLPNSSNIISINGNVVCGTKKVQRVKEFIVDKLKIDDTTNINGNIKLILEYSDDNKNWNTYDIYQLTSNKEVTLVKQNIALNYVFENTKRVSLNSHDLYLRMKFEGNGTIKFKNANSFSVDISGSYVLSEKYDANIDEETDIFIESSEDTFLKPTRSLLHKDNFFSTSSFYKRNQKQTITLFLILNGGIKAQVLKETYTDNFISNIAISDESEKGFFIFESNNTIKPKISVPAQVKQLLFEKNGKYINKLAIDPKANFGLYGYKIEDGIYKFDKNGRDLGKIINKDIEKINFSIFKTYHFNELLIGTPIKSAIKDASNKLIFEGEILLSEIFQENVSTIMNLIKTKKTFYKMSIILYSEYTKEIENLVKTLSAGNETPQDVFLVCSNPNDSNIEKSSFNKISLGKNTFKNEVIKSIKNKIGLQFTSLENVINEISLYINECIRKKENFSLTNAVGINVYDFVNSEIDNNYYNKYGYYINEITKNYTENKNFKMLGISKDNSLENVVQYDIGTSFSAEIDITEDSDITKENCVEDNDNIKSISITHNNNILWKYVIGEEEIGVYEDEISKARYDFSINNSEEKTILKLKTNFNFDLSNRGENNFTVIIKEKNCIKKSYIMDFIVDYPEPRVNKFNIKTSDEINEVGYNGKRDLEYSKDNFFEIGLNMESNYEFLKDEYSILISNKNFADYKKEIPINGLFQSKIFTVHIDDIKNESDLNTKLKFGNWDCKLIRNKFKLPIKVTDLNIPLNIDPALDLIAVPVEEDFEDIENNGLQQGKDVYIKFKLKNSDYFKKIRDFIYFCKEVRFIVNGVNYTAKPENFTYLDTLPGINSLQSVTNHSNEELDERNEMRWMISGTSESNSNKFLHPVANLAGDEKKTKTIRLDFVLFDNTVIDTANVKIGHTGKIKAPIICGSDEHFEKLKYVFAKSLHKNVDDLTSEELQKIKEQLESLGKSNYENQQIVNNTESFVFYSNLLEIKFDFGICEYFTISQANNVTDLIPVTRDGLVRYVINENGIDENSKGTITIKGYIKLSDGLVISSEERNIPFYRKKLPSLITTGDDYTKYVNYEIDKDHNNYYNLKTVIQSKLVLEDLNKTYSSEWMDHIEVELVDVDKQTIIAYGPDVKFYEGFIPQRFIFDTGLTEDDLNSITEEERFPIEKTKKYKEIEKILNDKIFSKNKHLGQTFYLRFKGVEIAKNKKGENVKIFGKESFYPILFTEKLKELVIIPATGIIVQNDGFEEKYYTYKNKVSVILESNNAEYFMYRTDRSSSFQKVYPKEIGYTKTLKIVVSTYDVGNHMLEVKQKAEGETESNVYSIIVEKINSVKPPHITGKDVTDENPEWTLYPIEDATKYKSSVITEEKEHSEKTLDALQYETKIQPDYYLENGYHILKVIAFDKINNASSPSYSITRKIGIPVASKITGSEKTSEDFIEWTWKSQYHEGVRQYIVEVNGLEKSTIPASLDGYNNFVLRHFQGKPLVDGTYEIRIWAVNELGNRSYIYSSFLTEKGSKIKELAFEFYKYKGDYTNKLQAKILTDDPAIKQYQYEIFKNVNGEIVSVTGPMYSNKKELPFLKTDGSKVELENGEYYFAVGGINYIDEKTEYIMTPFIFRVTAPEKPFIYYLKTVKTTNPIFFVKETGNEMISSIEIKVGDHNFEKIRNNAWRPNYALNLGTNNVVIRITDFAGNQAEYGDFIEITPKGINQFQEDYMADMKKPVVKLDFNLPDMSNFGHINFRIQQETLGIDAIINVLNANSLELPLTTANSGIFPDGTYTFVIKLYDELTNSYDYIADYFAITIDSNKPLQPYFLNNGYSGIEYNRQYTKNRNPKWIWQTKDVVNLKEYIVDLFVLDDKENNYVEYGNGQFNNYSTQLVGQFQSPDEFKDGTYKLTVKSIGLNNLESDPSTFFIVIKNSLPKPPHFDIGKNINRKYENRNTNISWIWEDLNTGNDVFVKYKIKINNQEFSDEINGTITHYEETRALQDGPNTIYVIGCDKAGNWSTANEISANQFGTNYLSHTKIIDTVIPEKMSEEDVVINILDSKSFEALFRNDSKSEEYFLFELFTLNNELEEVYLVKGNTLKPGTSDIFFNEKEVKPGVNLGELKGTEGYCEIKTTTNKDNIQKSLYFTNLLNNKYYLRIYGVDYAGNISEPLIKEIDIKDLTKIKPMFILPKEKYTNNSTIVFQWLMNEPNIKAWQYQLITPYNNSRPDLTNEDKWKTINDNSFTLFNIPKIIAGNDADGDYTLYVRAVFDEIIQQEGTDLEVNKKSDINSITVHLDRKIPKGILFTNKTYTDDNSVLRWTWNYTGDGDEADGVYLTFNPNLPIEEWDRVEFKTVYESFKERPDGMYTIYARTFDRAGNINENIFSNTITLDRIPPFKPIINGGSNIFTNTIPTVYWENDNNYFKYYWLVLPLEEYKKFEKVYNKLVNEDYYKLTNDDWKFLFSKECDITKVQDELKTFEFNKNDPITQNQILINSSNDKNGISEEGEYVFLLSGHDQNYNWAEEYELQFITYDITLPDVSQMKFISPDFTITEERRPLWKWRVPIDVCKCKYILEKNGYSDGSVTGEIFKKPEKFDRFLEYEFRPDFNLTAGEYRLVVECYDLAGNSVQIDKNLIIKGDSNSFGNTYFDIILPGLNNRIRIKMNDYSDVYVITEIDLNKNSALTYKIKGDLEEFKIYEMGKTELSIKEEYEFNILQYELKK